ncbi:hypothetical protein XENORESO_001663 [Xenotaenia resolanae]|uniref:Uncharacterized protein n=1 Tax=Xenotaenia resolanae TaxID=208358 RepID=A0ABV0VUA7_9TELE
MCGEKLGTTIKSGGGCIMHLTELELVCKEWVDISVSRHEKQVETYPKTIAAHIKLRHLGQNIQTRSWQNLTIESDINLVGSSCINEFVNIIILCIRGNS